MKPSRFHTKMYAALLGAAFVLGAFATTASAGRGGSHARIQNAINTGSSAAIIAEIERAERLICSSACIETVMSLLDDPRYEVREAAGWWFARRPAQMKELQERSYAALIGDDSIAARNAADMLGAFRRPAGVAPLSAAAVRDDLSAEARFAAVRSLGLIGHLDAGPALAVAMNDSDAEVRRAALTSWRTLRGQADAAPAIVLLSDEVVEVRREAAAVIGSLRDGAARAALEQRLLDDEDPLVRRNAAYALGRIGDASARASLQAATSDESSLVRMSARAALNKLR